MMRHSVYSLLFLSLLFIFSGCAIFPKSPTTPTPIDPLVERNREWSKQVETGNDALERRDLRAALAAYNAAVEMRPDSSEVQRKIAEIYFQLEEYENARNAFATFLAHQPNNITALNLSLIHI